MVSPKSRPNEVIARGLGGVLIGHMRCETKITHSSTMRLLVKHVRTVM